MISKDDIKLLVRNTIIEEITKKQIMRNAAKAIGGAGGFLSGVVASSAFDEVKGRLTNKSIEDRVKTRSKNYKNYLKVGVVTGALGARAAGKMSDAAYDAILKKRIKRGLAKISTWNSSDDGDKQDKIERMRKKISKWERELAE